MAKAVINAGVCGFITEITAESEDLVTAILKVSSQCPAYAVLEGREIEVEGMKVCFGKLAQNEIYDLFRETCRHSACPVPAGALKAVEVACELALPRDVSMKIEK